MGDDGTAEDSPSGRNINETFTSGDGINEDIKSDDGSVGTDDYGTDDVGLLW